jgi:ketosteroid isomerase-like protein
MLRSKLRAVRIDYFLLLLVMLVLPTACQRQAATNTSVTDETTLRNLDDEWSKAVGAKDVEKTMAYYVDDALMMPPNIPPLTGKVPIRALWKSLLEAPSFSGGWKASKIDVARAGDLAYVSGSYELTESDDNGQPMTDKGKYLQVWKKQSDNNWKCVAHTFSSDLPR